MENPIKMDDLGVPLFSETSISHGVDFSLQLVPVDFYSVFEFIRFRFLLAKARMPFEESSGWKLFFTVRKSRGDVLFFTVSP